MSDKPTPRTDAIVLDRATYGGHPWENLERLSRQLERDLAATREQLAAKDAEIARLQELLGKYGAATITERSDLRVRAERAEAERDAMREQLSAKNADAASADAYKQSYDRAVAGVIWMHGDDSLGLRVGQTLLVHGVQALREQRDALRTRADRAEAERDALRAELCRKTPGSCFCGCHTTQIGGGIEDGAHPMPRSATYAELTAENVALRAERDALRKLVLWALGENGKFPERPERIVGKPYPMYYWRREMRGRFTALTRKYAEQGGEVEG